MIRASVIGWPIRHSRSPIIHNYWLRHHGIDGVYDKQAVAPEELPDFLRRIGGEFAGCNVTVPHKEAVMRMLGQNVDATARAVGAVNTVWSESGALFGMNTDVEGFLSNLDHGAPGWDKAPLKAVVLGAGGAARAVVYGLVQRGAEDIAIFNRSTERANELARELGGRAIGPDQLGGALASASLVVNATSLGMSGQPELDIDLGGLNPTAVVTDLVYVPLRTKLIADAGARGNRTVDGLGMLLHQAVPGFEKWFGVRPEVTPELRRLAERDIEAAP